MEKEKIDTKLQIRVENGLTASGRTSLRSMGYSQIKINASYEQLLAAGKAIANLQAKAIAGIRVLEVFDLMDSE